MPSNQFSAIEKHIQTGIQVLIIALLAWFGIKTLHTSDAVIRLEEQVKSIKATIDTATHDRFTRSDAEAMKSIFNYRIQALERRITNLEPVNGG